MHDINLVAGENAVLLLHGLASSPLEMRYVAKMLHRDGFSVSVPHIAGYGHGKPVTDWSEWHAKALDAFTKLKREYRTVSVGGLCIGAVLALSLAADKRRDITALSLLSTTLFYDGWAMPWYRFLLPLINCAPLRNRSSFRERAPYGVKNELLRKRIARAMREESLTPVGAPSISMNHIYQATRLIGHVKRNLGAVESPALVMHAIDDDVASVKNADFIVDRIGSKIVRKVVLNDCYHIVTMDNERARVVDETSSFFMHRVSESAAGLRSGARARVPDLRASAGLVAVAA